MTGVLGLRGLTWVGGREETKCYNNEQGKIGLLKQSMLEYWDEQKNNNKWGSIYNCRDTLLEISQSKKSWIRIIINFLMHKLICYRPPNVNIKTSGVNPLETVLIFCLVTCYASRRGSKNRWPERLNRMPGHPSRESGWTHITPHRVCNYGKNGRKTGWLIFWRGHRPSKYLSLRSSTPLTLKVLLRQNQGAAKMCSK